MLLKIALLVVAAFVGISGCGTRSSAKPLGNTMESPWDGPVFVTQGSLPADIKYKLVGSVQADARGYDSVVSLYPLLASQARVIGANAVIGAIGGRRMTALSWSSPYITGTAVRVEDPEKLKGLSGGAFH